LILTFIKNDAGAPECGDPSRAWGSWHSVP